MKHEALIAGGGIGGLAAALALGRAGWGVRLFEQAQACGEVGAGIQLGPNGVRVLHGWGLADDLAAVAAFPASLQVRSVVSGRLLGTLRLGDVARQRYGTPYATVHRADLHDLLLRAAWQHSDLVQLNPQHVLQQFTQTADAVTVRCMKPAGLGPEVEGDALIGADGLWSQVRQGLLGDGPPRPTGHLAYRALVPQASLPSHLRSQHVTAWLGPRQHVVQYPVRGGDWLNVVGIVHGQPGADVSGWDQAAQANDLRTALAGSAAPLQDLVQAIDSWRMWVLNDRVPVASAAAMAQGRVALLGDAAHPMRPYLAQGAGMAIEDAAELGRLLAQAQDPALDVPTLLSRYALNRWQRNARVQARAIRNGQIFHATGLVRWGRDVSLKLLGERVLDMPWLYGAG